MQRHPALDGIGTAIFDDLKPMPREEFKEVIVGPAARATEAGQRLVIKDNLVARLLEDVGEGADTLPLLALTLSRLYADYGGTGEISASDYEAMGGMADVVNNAIDELVDRLPGWTRERAGTVAIGVYPVAGHHQLAQRSGIATGGPRVRPAQGQPTTDRRLRDKAAAGARRARRPGRRRGRPGKPAAPMGCPRRLVSRRTAEPQDRRRHRTQCRRLGTPWPRLVLAVHRNPARRRRKAFHPRRIQHTAGRLSPLPGGMPGSRKPAAARRRRVAQRKATPRRGSRPGTRKKANRSPNTMHAASADAPGCWRPSR